MAKHSRSKAAADSVASEVVACLVAHTDLPQADFSAKRKIKRFAAGGKRRSAVIRALLARPALKQLGLRQRHFDRAELSGKSTIGDIIEVIATVAETAKAVRPPAKKRAVKKGSRAGTTRRPVKARRKVKTSAASKAKASGKAKRAAASKTSRSKTLKSKAAKNKPAKSKTAKNKTLKGKPQKVKTPKKAVAKSKLPKAKSVSPKRAVRKAAPQRAVPKSVAGKGTAPKRADGPRAKRIPRAARTSREATELKVQQTERDVRAEPPALALVASNSFQADAIDDAVSSAMSGADEANFETDARPDRPADGAAEASQPSRHANALLHDADQDG